MRDNMDDLKDKNVLNANGRPLRTQDVPGAASRQHAERLLEERLLEALRARLGDGEVVHTSFSSAQRDGRLEVTLQAECTEEIGRFVPLESITEENEAEP